MKQTIKEYLDDNGTFNWKDKDVRYKHYERSEVEELIELVIKARDEQVVTFLGGNYDNILGRIRSLPMPEIEQR